MTSFKFRVSLRIIPKKTLFLAIILVGFVSGCHRPIETETPTRNGMQVSSTARIETVEIPRLPSATASQTATPSPQLEITITPSLTLIPPQKFVLCSPLAEQNLAEIWEIVSDPYAPPPPGKDDRHHGVDLAYYRRKDRTTIEGEGVTAVLTGTVRAVITNTLPYGNMVMIETSRDMLPASITEKFQIDPNESLYSLYAHLREPSQVKLGETVRCGQPLGEVGATGYNIVNAHLHLETRVGPTGVNFIDGLAYYDTRTTPAERANYEWWRTSGDFRHFDPMLLIDAFLSLSD
jgi:murein DD-endopeptidase MepM/ murein hydrolase activator NlpD